ncbi:hypothetical protein H1R20_g6616, partial [Candolleomyces eurysporus]
MVLSKPKPATSKKIRGSLGSSSTISAVQRKITKPIHIRKAEAQERHEAAGTQPAACFVVIVDKLELMLTLSKEKRNRHLDVPDDSVITQLPTSQSDLQNHDIDLREILDGTIPLDISYAGGEYEIMQNFNQGSTPRPAETRTRRDRIELQNQGFEDQIPDLVNAYMLWRSKLGQASLEKAGPVAENKEAASSRRLIQVLDIYDQYHFEYSLLSCDASIAAAVVRQGLVPCAPFNPSFSITIRALETYRLIQLRSPSLSIEAFVKSLCDLNGASYRKGLREFFSSGFDLYLRLREEVQKKVENALGRDVQNWRRRNACAGCTYKLKNEVALRFGMLVTFDGNDSLKRVARQAELSDTLSNSEEMPAHHSIERGDHRRVYGDFYLSREAVDRWDRRATSVPSGSTLPTSAGDLNNEPIEADEDETPCAGRWQNMNNEVTARMWGIFDETGVFLALCRHGFVLVIADMIKSGELSKYPLAVVEALLDAYGNDIGGGYDIGCKFHTTLAQSKLGPRAQQLNYRSLVGAFHGHAHNRLCQLSNLATYVKGMGLEDLEGCERFFSKSNLLANLVRHASVFHRQQRIVEYLRHMNAVETEQNLSKFICDNYKQALAIMATESHLKVAMAAQGISDTNIFELWLDEEREYLKSLKKEPTGEVWQMDYYQMLVNLADCEEKLRIVQTTFISYNPLQKNGKGKGKRSVSHETQLRHAIERRDKVLAAVQQFEVDFEISARWAPESQEWQTARDLTSRRRYQRCLDELESLVVSRIFELTKMNMSRTGYKLRKHISKALQARSQAIRTALDRYNDAASKMVPPRQQLTWDQNVRSKPWAQPQSRLLMDQYFKIQRAREEIQRLNIEIKRIVTHIQDEENFLRAAEEEIAVKDTILAFHVGRYREERTRFSSLHLRRFSALMNLPGFTGNVTPGQSIDQSLHRFASTEIGSTSPAAMDIDSTPHSPPVMSTKAVQHSPCDEDRDSDFEDVDEEEELAERFNLLNVLNQ